MVLRFVLSVVCLVPTTVQKSLVIKKQEIAMPQGNNHDALFYWLIGIVAAFFLIISLVGLGSFLSNFFRELRYINCEIKRNDGVERRYWMRKRRRLFLSLIPFVKY